MLLWRETSLCYRGHTLASGHQSWSRNHSWSPLRSGRIATRLWVPQGLCLRTSSPQEDSDTVLVWKRQSHQSPHGSKCCRAQQVLQNKSTFQKHVTTERVRDYFTSDCMCFVFYFCFFFSVSESSLIFWFCKILRHTWDNKHFTPSPLASSLKHCLVASEQLEAHTATDTGSTSACSVAEYCRDPPQDSTFCSSWLNSSGVVPGLGLLAEGRRWCSPPRFTKKDRGITQRGSTADSTWTTTWKMKINLSVMR